MIKPDPKPITVGQLIEHLKTFDNKLIVLFERFSDYDYLYLDEVTTQQVLIDKGKRSMRYYSYQFKTEEEKEWARSKLTTVLVFPGN